MVSNPSGTSPLALWKKFTIDLAWTTGKFWFLGHNVFSTKTSPYLIRDLATALNHTIAYRRRGGGEAGKNFHIFLGRSFLAGIYKPPNELEIPVNHSRLNFSLRIFAFISSENSKKNPKYWLHFWAYPSVWGGGAGPQTVGHPEKGQMVTFKPLYAVNYNFWGLRRSGPFHEWWAHDKRWFSSSCIVSVPKLEILLIAQ